MNLAHAEITPLSVDEAYPLTVTLQDCQTIVVQWHIAPGYFLYKNKIHFQTLDPQTAIAPAFFPPHVRVMNSILGPHQVYSGDLNIAVPITKTINDQLTLQIHYQGCAEKGFCYPPMDVQVPINVNGPYHQPLPTQEKNNDENSVSHYTVSPLLQFNHPFWLCFSFLGFGILLAFTPCVLPVLPILSSIVLGQQKIELHRSMLLSGSYILGMSLSYAAIGFVFALLGLNLQVVLQNPVAIIILALLLVALAIAMFGGFTLQLPTRWQHHLSQKGTQHRGTLLGAIIMGFFSALVLSPCVTPPLVGALTFISTTGNLFLGSSALFFLGLGMGIPLFILGTLGGKFLPRAGIWMERVKHILGCILIALAIYILVTHFSTRQTNSAFQTVTSNAELTQALSHAKPHQMVLLDFYADWCTACKIMDHTIFANPSVKPALKNMLLLRADVTANNAAEQALEKNYNVVAPPTILFFQDGKEIPNSRIVGEVDAQEFLEKSHLPHSS